MSASADQTRLTLYAGGYDFEVLGLAGSESFNMPFIFTVEVLSPTPESLVPLLGTDARLQMTAPDGSSRKVCGIVTEVYHRAETPDGLQLWRTKIATSLHRLQLRTDSRLILGRTVPEIIRETLERNGISNSAIRCRWKNEHPVRPTTVQAGETDYGFVARLCSRAGILFWSESEEENEILNFVDSSGDCLPLPRGPLVYRPSSGFEKVRTDNDILTLTHKSELTSTAHVVHDVLEQLPEDAILAERLLPGGGGGQFTTRAVTFGSGVTHLDDAETEAWRRAKAAMVSSSLVTVTSHAVDLRPGTVVRIEAEHCWQDISGDYLITEVRHKSRQYAGVGLGGDEDCPYTNEVTLVSRASGYWVHPVNVPQLPLTFTARIESRDMTANLDDDGRTRFYQHNDNEMKEYAENSIPIRRLQPYGGTGMDGHIPGWHMPLQDGAEILLSCLNNDPDRLMIAGSLPNPDNLSPVTDRNAHQNRIRTAADHELCFDDKKDAPLITMRTFNGHNMLHLDGALAEHRIGLFSDQGLAEFFAKKTFRTTCGDTCDERVGHNRTLVVEDSHRTETRKAEIHHQAATDILLRAGRRIDLTAGANIELENEEDCTVDIAGRVAINVDGLSSAIEIDSGKMTIQADGAIVIEGDGGGDIVFAQNGAGIKMDSVGNITLFGETVTFDTPGGVGLFGKVNIDICDPPHVSVPGGVAADKVIGIRKFQDLDDEEANREKTITLEIRHCDLFAPDDAIHQLTFPLLDGTSYMIVTDTGNVYEGAVHQNKIIVQDCALRSSFDLLIDGIHYARYRT